MVRPAGGTQDESRPGRGADSFPPAFCYYAEYVMRRLSPALRTEAEGERVFQGEEHGKKSAEYFCLSGMRL